VAIVDPAACKRVEPPPVVIEQVIADGSVIAGDRLLAKKPDFVHSTSGGPISLAPGHGQSLIIRFTANCFDAPQLVQFRYKLEGWDQDWVAAADQRQAIYTTLRPGSYRFRIAAADSHGVWNGRGAEFAFGVEPKFTQTGWFTAALAAAGAALVGLFIGWRLKWERMKLRAEKAAAMTEERTRIADDLHDELGGSFTELSVLGSLTAARVDTPDDIRRRGRRITEAAGELADAVDEIVWSLDSRRNSIVDLATYAREFGERMLEPAGIACRWDVPADLPPAPLRAEVRHQLMRLTKEALNNAVKHSRASEVVFQLRWGADSFRWIIADNGAGFDITARSDAGNGLASMRRRVETVGGRLVIMSDRGCGTRIEAEIPMTARRDG
jgi:signal transduction histidine kinase